MKSHLKHMIIGGAVILVALMAFGVSWRQAIQYAALLACPVIMVFMMAGGHGHGGHGGHGGQSDGSASPDDGGRGQIGPDREQIQDPTLPTPHNHEHH